MGRRLRYNGNMSSLAAAPPSPAVSPLRMAANALDVLDQDDPADLPSAALGDEIEGLFTIQNRVAAALTRRVAGVDRTQSYAALGGPSPPTLPHQRIPH